MLGIVFLTLTAVIKDAYILHDTVTGSIILEETVAKAAYNRDEEKDAAYFADWGEETGTPRLWLGAYRVELEIEERKAVGSAAAGDWDIRMELQRFRPEVFMRRIEALAEMGKMQNGSEGGISTGNEPELYGSGSGGKQE